MKQLRLQNKLYGITQSVLVRYGPLSFALPNSLRAANDVMFTMMSCNFVDVDIQNRCKRGNSQNGSDLCTLGVWIAMTIDWFVQSNYICNTIQI